MRLIPDTPAPSAASTRAERVPVSLPCLLLLAAAVALSTTSASSAGTLSRHTDAARDYLVYQPEITADPPALLVYLHGCTQTAEDALVGARLAQQAELTGLVVVLPEQSPEANGGRCWNWFLPESQSRESGETAIIAGITQTVIGAFGIDARRVYVMGASAGAAMATNLGATYPELYAAVGILAGCPFRTCSDVTGILAFGAMAERARAVPAFVAHGTADPVVAYPLARASVSEWLGVADLADDGLLDGSVSRLPDSVEQRGFDQTPAPGTGDPCIGGSPARLPCAGGVAGFDGRYPHTIERWNDAAGRPLVELWTLHGAGHAIPGGDPAGSFVDPLGPDVVGPAIDFFLRTGDAP